MEFIRTFSVEQYTAGLESWSWLDLAGKQPVFTSPFGHVFLKADDGIWWLDILTGNMLRPWEGTDELRADLDTSAGCERYLLAALALEVDQRGLLPADDQVYDFMVPPVLGGGIDARNLDVVDFVISLNVAGQIHRQIRNSPPGTPVSIGIAE